MMLRKPPKGTHRGVVRAARGLGLAGVGYADADGGDGVAVQANRDIHALHYDTNKAQEEVGAGVTRLWMCQPRVSSRY